MTQKKEETDRWEQPPKDNISPGHKDVMDKNRIEWIQNFTVKLFLHYPTQKVL